MSHYYPRILKVLKERNISNYRFAQMLEVPETTFSNWIRGLREPPFHIVEKTALLLDISIDEIIFELPKKKQ